MAALKRVIAHWAVTKYKATDLALQHYHFVVEGDGKIVAGKFPPEANIKPVSGRYAAHTLNCNTGSIAVSCAAMAGAETVKKPGDYPITEVQFEAMCRKIADLCKKYGIEVTSKTVLSHAEVEINLGIKQRGKWDIAVLPFARLTTAKSCGDLMRKKVAGYLAQPKTAPIAKLIETPITSMALSIGDKGSLVAELKRNLNVLGFGPLTEDDMFDEPTKAEVEAFQAGHKGEDGKPLEIDGLVGIRTSKAIQAAMLAPTIEEAKKTVPPAVKEEVKDSTGMVDKVGKALGSLGITAAVLAERAFGAEWKTVVAIGGVALIGVAVWAAAYLIKRRLDAKITNLNAAAKQ